MKYFKNKPSQGYAVAIAFLTFISGSPAFASSIVSGGAMTWNIDSTALAAAFSIDSSERPSFYVEEYFNAAQAVSRTDAEILNQHIVPGVGQISSSGLVFSVNGSSTSGLNKANDFSFNTSDLTGTATGAIGLGGAVRYRLDRPFNIDSISGEEIGNRVINGYMTLEYDASRTGIATGYSGWVLYNHYTFKADIFDLVNVSTTLTEHSLALTGDLALGSGFSHMTGTTGSIVGDFSFQTTVVPVPAAVWFFVSGIAGLFIKGYKQQVIAL